MGRNKKPFHWKKWLLILLLLVLCVGGVELAVCRFADPELYQSITAPVRRGAASLGEAAHTALDALHQRLSPKPEPEEELLEDQAAGEPEIVSDLIPADPIITEFQPRGDQEILVGGSCEVVYYNQADAAWFDQPYGWDNVGKYGCGPTAMAMVVSSLTDHQINPAEMAVWANQQGYCARGSGSYSSIVEGTAGHYGLTVESFRDFDPQVLRRELAAGKVAVALMTKGHFTQKGHFIVLRGTTLDGGILVADPNSRERSLVVWDAQLILDELSASRGSGGPLWMISNDQLRRNQPRQGNVP